MSKRKAFSLIELLVVISVISLLIALVVPAVSAARRRGEMTLCQTRLREAANALWAYSVANDSRVPYVVSPLTNGGSIPGFGNAGSAEADINPYDRAKWPLSMQSMLMPLYLGDDRRVFVCPAAIRGWPRNTRSFECSYRDAGANQPNGLVAAAGSYFRENFGFLDGRHMNELKVRFTADPIVNAQLAGRLRSTYLRDMVVREGTRVIGPHNGGVNVINREFGIEFRDQKTAQQDLGPGGAGVQF